MTKPHIGNLKEIKPEYLSLIYPNKDLRRSLTGLFNISESGLYRMITRNDKALCLPESVHLIKNALRVKTEKDILQPRTRSEEEEAVSKHN